ncbi:DUF885 family protein [Gemmatimonas sp.]|uniref:DUF885 family protein n=1 Tax=Gemmatimonas sp. TaxID=1962908 RepID=UPI00333E831F
MRSFIPFRTRRRLYALALLAAGIVARPGNAAAQSDAQRDSVVQLAEALRTLRTPPTEGGVPVYSPETLRRWRSGLDSLRARHAAFNTAGWSVADRIDHILVRTQLDAVDFELRVLRPWARDPGHWVDLLARTPYTGVPLTAEGRTRLTQQLRAVPRTIAAARRSLTEPAGELAGIAHFHLTRSDGVNQGEPRRDPPPAGIIGWYEDLRTRLVQHDPTLVPLADSSLTALRAFAGWLAAERPRMTAPAHIGLEDYAWYLRHVRLVPLNVEQVRLIGEREIARARSLLAFDRHKYRALPPIVPVTTAEEHERRTREAETHIRTFTQREKLLTIPNDIPPQYETDAFFIDRSAWGGARHFWEELTYRDPLNNHVHASIPGHRFDGALQRRQPRPIRRAFSDGTRAEGWAFYIEEMYLHTGLLDDRPKGRELFWIAQLKRAARVHAELRMQTGEWTLDDAIKYLVREVPLMEENLARYDLAIYLRRPAYGMNYTIGKTQLEQLLADRQRQLGDAFDLGAFHDAFLAAGPIPIALIRWELTGLDDELRALGVLK